MANLTINLKGQTATPTVVPGSSTNSGTAAPNTGVMTVESGGAASSNTIAITSAVLAIFLIIGWVGYYLKKHKGSKTLLWVFIVFLITALAFTNIEQPNANANNGTGNTNENALSISVDDFYFEIEPTNSGAFGYGKHTVTVSEASSSGYTLSAYTTTPDLVNTKDNTQKISSIRNLNTSLAMNTWGFATVEPTDETSEVWSYLPTDEHSASILFDTDMPSSPNDATDIYYGVKVNTELAPGEYIGKVVYVAIAKSTEPVNPNPGP